MAQERPSDSREDHAPAFPPIPAGDHVDRIIEEWSREAPDLDTEAVALIGRLMRASRLLQLEVEGSLGEFELTINEFNALSALRRSGPSNPLSAKDVGISLLFSSGGLTKLLERLEGRGLVIRETNPADGRGVLVSLTPKGRDLQEEAMAAHAVNEEELLAPLTRTQRESLSATLRDLLIAFETSNRRRRPASKVAAAASRGSG